MARDRWADVRVCHAVAGKLHDESLSRLCAPRRTSNPPSLPTLKHPIINLGHINHMLVAAARGVEVALNNTAVHTLSRQISTRGHSSTTSVK